jgi:hypothetical protein
LSVPFLLIRVPRGRREVSPQFLSRTAWSVSGCVALDAPSFFKKAGIHHIEAELIEQEKRR